MLNRVVERGRRHAWLLASICVVGCADPQQPEPKPIRYTEHLVCVVTNEGARLQHMYRIDLESAQAEFVGGFGGRIISLESRQLLVAPDEERIAFAIDDAQSRQEFEVIIHRQRLSYAVVRNQSQNQDRARLFGQCSVLDGQQLHSRPAGGKPERVGVETS